MAEHAGPDQVHEAPAPEAVAQNDSQAAAGSSLRALGSAAGNQAFARMVRGIGGSAVAAPPPVSPLATDVALEAALEAGVEERRAAT